MSKAAVFNCVFAGLIVLLPVAAAYADEFKLEDGFVLFFFKNNGETQRTEKPNRKAAR